MCSRPISRAPASMSTICCPRESSTRTARPARTTPGRRSSRRSTTISTRISPGQKTPYNNTDQQAADARNLLRAADMLHRRRNGRAQWSGLHGHAGAGRAADYGLLPAGPAAADDRRDRHPGQFARYPHPELQQPAERPLSAGEPQPARDHCQPLCHVWRQPGASLLSDVAAARLRRQPRPRGTIRADVRPTCSPGSRDRLLRQQRQSDAEAARRKATSRWASTMSPRATRPI